jgi:uncharacterized protein (DUF934 family)
MRLVKGNQTIADTWRVVSVDAPLPAHGDIVVTVSRWLADRSRLLDLDGRVGVTMKADDDLTAVVADLEWFALVALDFGTSTDGRNYSIARLLRDRYAYQGELRATGEVRRDQLFFLKRCGFDAFLLADEHDSAQFLLGLNDFSRVYQTAADDRVPAYRLRAGSARSTY